MSGIFLFMGIQGAGKGTQANRLSQTLNIPHISTGDIFRAVIKQESDLGEELRRVLDSGELVSDELTSRMVEERISEADAQDGFILDGYPRNNVQADQLATMLEKRNRQLSSVFFFDLPEDEAVARLEPRRVCTADNAHIYHLVHNPPQQEDICDIDGAPLQQRSDDQPEAIKKRVSDYINQTMPLLQHYEGQIPVHRIDATQSIEAVSQEVLDYAKQAE